MVTSENENITSSVKSTARIVFGFVHVNVEDFSTVPDLTKFWQKQIGTFFGPPCI